MSRRHNRDSYYGDLGLKDGAGRKAVERAFWRKRMQAERADGSASDLNRVEEAYLVLSNPERRRQYDRMLGLELHPAWTASSERAARPWFDRCLAMLERGRERQALQLVRRAVALHPGHSLYRSYLGLLIIKTGGPALRALHHGRLAHQQAPAERRVALNLADIFESAGMKKRARQLRRKWRGGISSF